MAFAKRSARVELPRMAGGWWGSWKSPCFKRYIIELNGPWLPQLTVIVYWLEGIMSSAGFDHIQPSTRFFRGLLCVKKGTCSDRKFTNQSFRRRVADLRNFILSCCFFLKSSVSVMWKTLAAINS